MGAEVVLLIGFRVLVFREAEETAAGVKENGQVLERFLFATQYTNHESYLTGPLAGVPRKEYNPKLAETVNDPITPSVIPSQQLQISEAKISNTPEVEPRPRTVGTSKLKLDEQTEY